MIAFRKSFLLDLSHLRPSPIEQRELIEQMRIIENGHSLWSVPVSPSLPSVNEPGEVDIVLEHIRRDAEQADLLRRVLEP